MGRLSLDQWLQRLEGLHPTAMELGLERVAAVAGTLGLLQPDCPVVTVAGTNGKGSTVAVMEGMLAVLGLRAGVATSPHFRRFNERIRVAGQDASDDEIVSAFECIETARGDISLTYFEFATLASLLVFKRLDVDIMILEVGLGGRLDAANIIDPTVAIITRIDLDHQQWLGDSREQIAREKAGILRPGIVAVIADDQPPASLLDCLQQQACRALFIGRDFRIKLEDRHWQGTLTAADGERFMAPREQGSLLPANICAALQALLALQLEFSDAQLEAALGALVLAGRRELRQMSQRAYLLDVAHNPAAAVALGDYLQANPPQGRTLALFAPMMDKDIAGMIAACGDCIEAWFLSDQPGVARASKAADNAALLRQRGCGMISISKNVRQAFRRAQKMMGKGDLLVVFGSFLPVAVVMGQLDRDASKGVTGG